MLWRHHAGELPRKHHVALRASDGQLRYEHCHTRRGFDGAYTILYHENPPQAFTASAAEAPAPLVAASHPNRTRRHYSTYSLPEQGANVPVLFNDDVVIGVVRGMDDSGHYTARADADALYFVQRGEATLRSSFGDLVVGPSDYVCVPRGVVHRFVNVRGSPHWLSLHFTSSLGLPATWRNPTGQLRMDAPMCERDFRVPRFRGPMDEGIRTVVVTTRSTRTRCEYRTSPLDCVGYDGSVLPWAFSISAFQPRVGSVHLPPTWHGTFAAEGALVCSFVPRPLDFADDAVPCPYPHSSVDVDEVIYYVSGDFASRTGVAEGSLSLHPRGIPHGPHPGRYEASLGQTHTRETAVMLDCLRPLEPTQWASEIEDPGYEASFSRA